MYEAKKALMREQQEYVKKASESSLQSKPKRRKSQDSSRVE
jgi:hypothetical protein